MKPIYKRKPDVVRFPKIMMLRATLLFFLSAGVVAAPVAAQDLEFKNLKVLDRTITSSELNQVMLNNLSGLGLPRRGGKGCLFCHAGDMDVPRGEWDFASDEKVEKRKAREMLAMTATINKRLAGLEERVAPNLQVTCHTCHKGRTDPRSLIDHMLAAYRGKGIDAAVAVYRDLRGRYYGADAYDFRSRTLFSLAAHLARSGAYADGIVLARLNEEVFPGEASVRRGTLTLEIQQTLAGDGTEAALKRFDQVRDTEPAGTITPGVLDNLGWTLFRREQQQDALQIFKHNLEVFGELYIPNESLADALFYSGDQQSGIQVLERWTEAHPDDELARRALINLRTREE